MILHRLRGLALELSDADLRALADRLIEDANDVSGDIVLRAAKRGERASELKASPDDRAKIEARDPAIRLIDVGGWFEGEIRESWTDFAASRCLPPGATGPMQPFPSRALLDDLRHHQDPLGGVGRTTAGPAFESATISHGEPPAVIE
jgi:hypothetical protein